MKVYRILVDSSRRLSGHTYDFTYDTSGITTARDFIGHCWMMGVEWIDAVKYSEQDPTFGKNDNHPAALLLQCPSLPQYNTWQSWDGSTSSTIAFLPSYVRRGIYGLSADVPYCRKHHLACLVEGDVLNRAGSLRFRMMRAVDPSDASVRPCLQPDGVNVHGEDFSFRLVFWQVKRPMPEKPISPYYDFYKLAIRISESRTESAGPPGTAISRCGIRLVIACHSALGGLPWSPGGHFQSTLSRRTSPRGWSSFRTPFETPHRAPT